MRSADQTTIFLRGEADAWFERNKSRLGERDPVTDALRELNLSPKRILEVGCANGWRLLKLQKLYDCDVFGLDPSTAAIMEAHKAGLRGVHVGSARSIAQFADSSLDLIIFGFCLYLCDPRDLHRIAYLADRALQDEGYIVIHDFDSLFAFARQYKHRDGVFSYHMDFARLWLAHPHYRTKKRSTIGEEEVRVIQKRMAGAFPVCE